jgi:multicomponent Na+:H+ antiporter subunit F
MTTGWFVASLGLLPPLLAAILACGRRGIEHRLVAVELATTLAVLVFITLSFAFDQSSSLDLALTLALLTLPGTLLLALFEERWL